MHVLHLKRLRAFQAPTGGLGGCWHCCKQKRHARRGLVRQLGKPALLAATYKGDAAAIATAAMEELESTLVDSISQLERFSPGAGKTRCSGRCMGSARVHSCLLWTWQILCMALATGVVASALLTPAAKRQQTSLTPSARFRREGRGCPARLGARLPVCAADAATEHRHRRGAHRGRPARGWRDRHGALRRRAAARRRGGVGGSPTRPRRQRRLAPGRVLAHRRALALILDLPSAKACIAYPALIAVAEWEVCLCVPDGSGAWRLVLSSPTGAQPGSNLWKSLCNAPVVLSLHVSGQYDKPLHKCQHGRMPLSDPHKSNLSTRRRWGFNLCADSMLHPCRA